MRMFDIIEKKRYGQRLTAEEIKFFIDGTTDGSIPDSQLGAMLMTICNQGMSDSELNDLVKAMVESGETINLEGVQGAVVDKHSTGGVSDSTTLLITAIMTALDVKVAKMSGRALGHTGGTIDKLESFEGYNTNQSMDKFISIVNNVGGSIVSQTKELVPADKRLYALRDQTATVTSIPLIAASIMSKKIASGVKNLVLDVKYGRGAFVSNDRLAVLLAKKMVQIAKNFGINATAFVTNMHSPLGDNVGCNLEMQEVLDILKGQKENDLYRLSKTFCRQMLLTTNKATDAKQANVMIESVVKDGKALEKLKEIISAHGGNTAYFGDTKFPVAPYSVDVVSPKDGVITRIDALVVGRILGVLGGARNSANAEIDHKVGMEFKTRVGKKVKKGDVIAVVYANDYDLANVQAERLQKAIAVSGPKTVAPLIFAKVTKDTIDYDPSIIDKVKKETSIMEYEKRAEQNAEEHKYKKLVKKIEHTNLSQTASDEEIVKLCEEACKNEFAAVCIQPSKIAVAKKALANDVVKITTVVGFPYGEVPTKVKVLEAKNAQKLGVNEIDMVMCISKLKEKNYKYVEKEIASVVKAAKKCAIKVIIESTLLTDDEIRKAVECVAKARAGYVKTSTGLFGKSITKGATIDALNIIENEIEKQKKVFEAKPAHPVHHLKIKASGEIRTASDIKSFDQFADRIGTSNSLAIVEELKRDKDVKKAEKLNASDIKENAIPK